MDLTERLCRASGVSGHEDEVLEIVGNELRAAGCKVESDNFGNLVGVKGSGEPKIMLVAHADEVGLLVKHITKEGFIKFIKIGGIDDRILLHQRIIVKSKKGDVAGIIGHKPPHLMQPEEKKKVVKKDELYIDVGAKDKKAAEKLLEVGDPVIFEPSYGRLGKNKAYGKAVDNRIGCAALVEIMKNIPKTVKATIYAVASVQEEVGLKGARVAAFKLNPDYAIAVDTTIAGDTPGIKEEESSLALGKGPAITLVEASGRGVVTHPKVREVLFATAKAKKIPIQVDVLEGGMTDAAIIYLTREGIPSGVVSIPTRYIHGPSSVYDARDVAGVVKLVSESVKKLR